VATVVVVGAVLGVGRGVNAAADSSTTATVAKVVDGDTIDVRYDGETHHVRLLNVDTPESVDPNKPVECLGPEALGVAQAAAPGRYQGAP
jgi:micrococcal nuclease